MLNSIKTPEHFMDVSQLKTQASDILSPRSIAYDQENMIVDRAESLSLASKHYAWLHKKLTESIVKDNSNVFEASSESIFDLEDFILINNRFPFNPGMNEQKDHESLLSDIYPSSSSNNLVSNASENNMNSSGKRSHSQNIMKSENSLLPDLTNLSSNQSSNEEADSYISSPLNKKKRFQNAGNDNNSIIQGANSIILTSNSNTHEDAEEVSQNIDDETSLSNPPKTIRRSKINRSSRSKESSSSFSSSSSSFSSSSSSFSSSSAIPAEHFKVRAPLITQ